MSTIANLLVAIPLSLITISAFATEDLDEEKCQLKMAYPRCPCAWVAPLQEAEAHLETTCREMLKDSKHHRGVHAQIFPIHRQNHTAVIAAKAEIDKLKNPAAAAQAEVDLLGVTKDYSTKVAKASSSAKAVLDNSLQFREKTEKHDKELKKIKSKEICFHAKVNERELCGKSAEKIAAFQEDLLHGLSFDQEFSEKNADLIRSQTEYGHSSSHIVSAKRFADEVAITQERHDVGSLDGSTDLKRPPKDSTLPGAAGPTEVTGTPSIPEKIKTTGTFYPRTDPETGEKVMVGKDGQVYMRYNSAGQMIQQRDSETGTLYDIDPSTRKVSVHGQIKAASDVVPASIAGQRLLTSNPPDEVPGTVQSRGWMNQFVGESAKNEEVAPMKVAADSMPTAGAEVDKIEELKKIAAQRKAEQDRKAEELIAAAKEQQTQHKSPPPAPVSPPPEKKVEADGKTATQDGRPYEPTTLDKLGDGLSTILRIFGK